MFTTPAQLQSALANGTDVRGATITFPFALDVGMKDFRDVHFAGGVDGGWFFGTELDGAVFSGLVRRALPVRRPRRRRLQRRHARSLRLRLHLQRRHRELAGGERDHQDRVDRLGLALGDHAAAHAARHARHARGPRRAAVRRARQRRHARFFVAQLPLRLVPRVRRRRRQQVLPPQVVRVRRGRRPLLGRVVREPAGGPTLAFMHDLDYENNATPDFRTTSTARSPT
ncbi:hypothetical protein [Nannocystis pusilla]|uniref:hypothetical protein n=1 Tax=Nannocystis pusilla TaxID=889268 RepID=UPI003B760968